MTYVTGTWPSARTVEGVITDRHISPASGTGPSMSAAAAVCALLVAAVLTGAALAAPGSGLGVRTEGVATGVGAAAEAGTSASAGAAPWGPGRVHHPGGVRDGVQGGVQTSSRISLRYTTENRAPTSSNSSATAVP